MAMLRIVPAIMMFSLILTVGSATAQQGTELPRKRGANETIGLVADRSAIALATNLATVVDDDALRILPIVGRGPAQNLRDLLNQSGIDAAITQSDVLPYLERELHDPKLAQSYRYIAKLPDQTFHLLARADVASLADLAGQKVSVDLPDSGTAITASLLFEALHIKVEPVSLTPSDAIDKLLHHEIAAVAYLGDKPARLFHDLNHDDRVHFLAIKPPTDAAPSWASAMLTIQDYPMLIGAGEAGRGEAVDTIAVSLVLAVYDAPPGTPRYRRLGHFSDALLQRFSARLAARRTELVPADFSADVPGWTRFAPTAEWLKTGIAGSSEAPTAAIKGQAGAAGRQPAARRGEDALFNEFLQWQRQHRAPGE